MLELTKRPPIETVTLSFEVPLSLVEKAKKAMRRYEFEKDEEESVPWREVFKIKDEDMARTYLRGVRYREDLTQKALSELTGIPVRHISEMENGKRPIGKKNAAKLAEALNCNPRSLLSL